MGRRISLVVFLVTAFLTGVGFPLPSHATETYLTEVQVNAVLACQEAIKKAGKEFMLKKLQNLETCLDKALKIKMLFENGRITESDYNNQLATVKSQCAARYAAINTLSTEMVTAIADACGNSDASSVFDPSSDPLRFQQLAWLIGITIGNGDQLGGAICLVKEALVDLAVFTEVPRMGDLLVNVLGSPFYLGDYGAAIPAIPLDSRCFDFGSQTKPE